MRGKSEAEEAYVSEGNVLFSPPTGPRGFLDYPLVVYAPWYTIRYCMLCTIRYTYVDA